MNLRSSIEICLDDIKTGALPMSWDEHGGDLPTGHAVSRYTVCGEGLEISALGLDEGKRVVSLGNLAYAIPEGG